MFKSRTTVFTALFVIAGISSYVLATFSQVIPGESWPEVRRYPAEVVKIVDADTFDMKMDLGFGISITDRIRLDVVDAWETRGEEREKGMKAKKFVEDLMPPTSEVVVVTSGKRGKYGRVIAHIIVGGLDLGDELMEAGHGELYDK